MVVILYAVQVTRDMFHQALGRCEGVCREGTPKKPCTCEQATMILQPTRSVWWANRRNIVAVYSILYTNISGTLAADSHTQANSHEQTLVNRRRTAPRIRRPNHWTERKGQAVRRRPHKPEDTLRDLRLHAGNGRTTRDEARFRRRPNRP